MKILIATGIYPPDIGGPATYSEKLANAMEKRDHEAVVVTYCQKIKNKKEKIKNTNKKLKIVCISRSLPLILRYVLCGLEVIWHGLKADMIYAQDPVSVGLPATFANLFLRKKFVLKVVGDYAWEQSQLQISPFDYAQGRDFTPRLRSGQRLQNPESLDEFLTHKRSGKIRLLWEIERWVARRANLIITPSNYLKSVVRRWGIPEKKIKVVYNAVELPATAQSHGTNHETAQFHGSNHGTGEPVTIVSAGRLVPWKGFDALIEVMADMVKEKPDTELVIYGDGPLQANLRFKIKDLRLENHVKLVGRVSHDELLRALQEHSSIFVLNSSYEGMSHQILEAQALGVPVAVSRVGGNPEIVEDGKTGLLFEYNNKEQIKQAILRLLTDTELMTKITAQAGEQIKARHNFDKMTEKTLSILEELSK